MPTAPPIAQSSKRAVAYPDVGPRATTRIIEKVTCPRAPDPIGSPFEMASPTKVATKRATAVRPATFTKAVANPTPMMFPATVWKPCANVPYRLLWTVISATMGANTGESSPGRALAICQATATATEALMMVNQVSRLLGAFRRWLTGDRSVRLTPPTVTGMGASLTCWSRERP